MSEILSILIVYFLIEKVKNIVQVLQPWIQRRKIDYVKYKHVILKFLEHLRKRSLGRLLREDGEPDLETIKKLFYTIDTNHDGHISDSELRALIIGIQFGKIDLDHDAAVNIIMNDFDTSGNSCIDEAEFVNGISRWLNKARPAAARNAGPHSINKLISDFHMEIERKHDLLDVGGTGSDEVEAVEKSIWASIKAVLLLLLGTIIAAAFADPLVDTIGNFADATSIPAFFISFIVLPLATSSRETVSAIRLASQYKRLTASLSFSEVCFSFSTLLYLLLVILIVSIVMGLLGSFRTHFPLWTSILAILLYPFSLALVYVLHYYYGWS
ncbi:hypothetical protein ACB098_06G060800 [Castanea mollissima]